MSYEAIIARIGNLRKHPNADRLQLGTVVGNQVVVGLSTRDGDLGVFFPCDGVLSEEFVLANDLYSESGLAKAGLKPRDGQRFGFFDHHRRVKAQKFRGEKSDGFWCPLSYFDYLLNIGGLPSYLVEKKHNVQEGFTFSELLGHKICEKWETQATKNVKQAKLGKKQRENKCFPKHDVTKQFKYVARHLPTQGVFYITEKLHGTSGRYGYILDTVELPRWKQYLQLLLPKLFQTSTYRYLNGSKNVILENSTGEGYYGTNEFRYKAVDRVSLHKGEVIYFELVGYMNDQTMIMPPHEIKDDVKYLKAKYGDKMCYCYGCTPGESDIYVYKIVRMNEDGNGVELSWEQIKGRCKELGLKHVPELARYVPEIGTDDRDVQAKIEELVSKFTDGVSVVDPNHIREGVVLRIESEQGIEYVKNKSWEFKVLEGIIKSDENYVDLEESS